MYVLKFWEIPLRENIHLSNQLILTAPIFKKFQHIGTAPIFKTLHGMIPENFKEENFLSTEIISPGSVGERKNELLIRFGI